MWAERAKGVRGAAASLEKSVAKVDGYDPRGPLPARSAVGGETAPHLRQVTNSIAKARSPVPTEYSDRLLISQPVPGLEPLDWILIALYGAVVIGVGVWSNRRQKSTEDYVLGGRALPWWAVGVSLVATSFSSAALIGGTSFGYAKGMSYLQLQAGDFLAVAAACALFIPFFSRLRITTAYEYLERRFGVVARSLASALFIGQTVARAGILVYGPALALSVILGWEIEPAIVVTGAAAVLYSAAGGLAAVVWTDLLQFVVVVVGISAAIVVVGGDVPGGLAAVVDHASAAGRLVPVTWEFDMGSVFNLLGATLAYGTLALSVAGTNQQAVQRYLACKDASSARRAAFLGWGIGFIAVALTLFLGTSLAVWVDVVAVGSDVIGSIEADGNAVLPAFIVHRLPAGLAGLLVAAIFAASMSSMDSAIHSMSTATLVDFVRRFRRAPAEDAADLRLARYLTVAYGVIATGAAILAADEGKLLLDQLIRWLGYFAGPLLGLFLLGVCSRRANQLGAVVGVAIGGLVVVAAVVLEVPTAYHFHALWLAPLACVVTAAAGLCVSFVGAAPEDAQLDGLTVWDRHP